MLISSVLSFRKLSNCERKGNFKTRIRSIMRYV